jgi:branched-chain amino acid transport system ATP-binding protein
MSLSVENLSVTYGNIQVLWDISLTVNKGEIVSLVGANGAGKSTLLRSVVGLVKIRAGNILLDGRSVAGMRPHSLVRQGIGFVPEGRRLFGAMSVEDNLRMGAPRNCPDLESRLQYVLTLFPVLRDRKDLHAASLSGGEQQMVAIGRALMTKPKMLLLDELSFGLSPIMFERVLSAIEESNRSGVSVLLAEQNSERALEISNRTYIFENGRISGEGQSQELMHDPKIRSAYLGLAD